MRQLTTAREMREPPVHAATRRASMGSPRNGRPTAVVGGVDDVRGVYASRTLAREGIHVIGIANDGKSYGARTRACERVIRANTGNDELIEALVELGPQLDQKAILFPCYDVAVVNLSRHREVLSDWYRLALPSAESVETLTDKIRFYKYAQQNGLPIPETRFLPARSDAERASTELRFPVIVKPRTSKSSRWLSHTHLKAFIACDREQLLALYDQYAAHADGLIAQEWINGDDDSYFTCNGYFDANGEPLVTFVSRKLRQWPPSTGEGCLSIECRDDEIVRETLRVFGGFPLPRPRLRRIQARHGHRADADRRAQYRSPHRSMCARRGEWRGAASHDVLRPGRPAIAGEPRAAVPRREVGLAAPRPDLERSPLAQGRALASRVVDVAARTQGLCALVVEGPRAVPA